MLPPKVDDQDVARAVEIFADRGIELSDTDKESMRDVLAEKLAEQTDVLWYKYGSGTSPVQPEILGHIIQKYFAHTLW